MRLLSCPYLKGIVEISKERYQHIKERHPDLLPYWDHIEKTLLDPDQVRKSVRFKNAVLISRWFPYIEEGCHVVVVVMNEQEPQARSWMMTAYLSKKPVKGNVVWKRN